MLRVVLQWTSIPDEGFPQVTRHFFLANSRILKKLFSFRATFALRIWMWSDFTYYRKIPNCQNVYNLYFPTSDELDTNR